MESQGVSGGGFDYGKGDLGSKDGEGRDKDDSAPFMH